MINVKFKRTDALSLSSSKSSDHKSEEPACPVHIIHLKSFRAINLNLTNYQPCSASCFLALGLWVRFADYFTEVTVRTVGTCGPGAVMSSLSSS